LSGLHRGGEADAARYPGLQRHPDQEDRPARARLLLDRRPGAGVGGARGDRLPRRRPGLRLRHAARARPHRSPRGGRHGAMEPLSVNALIRGNGPGDEFAVSRRRMVAEHLAVDAIRDPRVLEAMATVPRHRFVDPSLWSRAYGDHALPTIDGQTLSQPYIVARM